MEFTQNALLMLLLFWTLQIVGSWIQWKHCRSAMNDATAQWSDGFLGAGQSKSRFAAGAVALLSVGPDMRVRQLRTMSGISVFARFRPDPSVQDWTSGPLGTHYAAGTRDTAVAQVEEVRSRQPAVMRAIEMTCDAARRAGLWVGICGEAAADLELMPRFIEMGVSEL